MQSEDRRIGLLIVIASLTLITIVLIVSTGWGYPTIPLFLFSPRELGSIYYDPDLEWLRPVLEFFSLTRNVIALLVVLFSYGLCRFFSLLPPIIRKKQSTGGLEQQMDSSNNSKSDA